MAVDTKALVSQFDNEQLNLIRATVAKDTTPEEFRLFIEVCKYHQLSPFARQIYAVVRKGQNGRQLTIQTSIDGYRLLAERSGRYVGQIGPEWCGSDGVWADVWTKDEPPIAARVGVLKTGCERPFWGIVKYKAFYVSSNPLWNKMPDHMLAIRAEALALRKAFPAEMSGIYTKEEMEQADGTEHTIVPMPHQGQTVVEEVVIDSEPKSINAGQVKTIQMLQAKMGKPELETDGLTYEDAAKVITDLNAKLREYNASKASKPVQPAQPVQQKPAPKQEQSQQEQDPAKALKARVIATLERAKSLNQFEVVEGEAVKNVTAFLKFASTIISANVTSTSQLTASRLDAIDKFLDSKDAA